MNIVKFLRTPIFEEHLRTVAFVTQILVALDLMYLNIQCIGLANCGYVSFIFSILFLYYNIAFKEHAALIRFLFLMNFVYSFSETI